MLWTEITKANNGVAKSNGGDVGLGFNLCVVPFLNSCVPNLPQRSRTEYVRGGWSWVRGVILESDKERLSRRS